MKRSSAILALTLVACGSSGPPPKTCDAGLCNDVCCPTDEICFTDPSSATKSCALPCKLSSVCPAATPCCEPVITNGSFTGTSVCAPTPPNPNSWQCSCGTSTECQAQECVPATDDPNGAISGPYICRPNDGQNHDGCAASPSICSVSQQYCATDGQNKFCSYECTSDSDCDNPGVACCNVACKQGSTCCGLCTP